MPNRGAIRPTMMMMTSAPTRFTRVALSKSVEFVHNFRVAALITILLDTVRASTHIKGDSEK
jgi:hypothetical protein